MATFIETGVGVIVSLQVHTDGSKHVILSGWSHDASGQVLRSLAETDVTASLTPTQQNEALDLVNAATAYLKSLWGIA